MAEVIRMPRMSDTMEEGVIVQWLKSVGDKVAPGDILAEVETDKATMELESFYEGYLLHIGVEKGAVPVDGVLAVIGEKDEDYETALKEAEQENGEEKEETKKESEETDEDKSKTEEKPEPESKGEPSKTEEKPQKSVTPENGQRIKASPLAKRMADEEGVNLKQISGSGDQGRIIKRDVEAYIESGGAAGAERELTVQPMEGPDYGKHEVSQMRKTLARRLAESKFSAPHFYLTIDVNMDQAVHDRKQINSDDDVNISFNDIVVKACAMALRKHPAVNSSWLGTEIETHREIHVGVAVAVDEGLLVPVIRNADYKSLAAINMEVKDYAERARAKKLQLDEMQGSTFTVSNLGMFGIEEFTAIINPPDACILAVGTIVRKPVVIDDEVVISNRMKVTLSCDHRVVDGATGAKFLLTVKSYLENPVVMLV